MKYKSLEDLKFVRHEELFTELTLEEAGSIEGGGMLGLRKVDGFSTLAGSAASNVCLTLSDKFINEEFIWSGKMGTEPDNYYLGTGRFIGEGKIKVYSGSKGGSSCEGSLLGTLIIPGRNIGPLDYTIKGTDGAFYDILVDILDTNNCSPY